MVGRLRNGPNWAGLKARWWLGSSGFWHCYEIMGLLRYKGVAKPFMKPFMALLYN